MYIYTYIQHHTAKFNHLQSTSWLPQKNFQPPPSHPVGHQEAPTLWPRGAGHHPVTSPSFQSWSPGDRPKPWPQKRPWKDTKTQ